MTILRAPSALGALALLALVLIASPASAADPALREGVHEGAHFSEAEIVELVAHATLYIGFGRFNEIIGIEPA